MTLRTDLAVGVPLSEGCCGLNDGYVGSLTTTTVDRSAGWLGDRCDLRGAGLGEGEREDVRGRGRVAVVPAHGVSRARERLRTDLRGAEYYGVIPAYDEWIMIRLSG